MTSGGTVTIGGTASAASTVVAASAMVSSGSTWPDLMLSRAGQPANAGYRLVGEGDRDGRTSRGDDREGGGADGRRKTAEGLPDCKDRARAAGAEHVTICSAPPPHPRLRRLRPRLHVLYVLRPVVHCLCIAKGVCFICATFLSTAAPRRGTLPDLEQQPSLKLCPVVAFSAAACPSPVARSAVEFAPGQSLSGQENHHDNRSLGKLP